MLPDTLSAAITVYRETFGHPVPVEVVQMFELRPGPLMMEIRQAVALNKPVPAWLARSKLPGTIAYAEWQSGPAHGGALPARDSRK